MEQQLGYTSKSEFLRWPNPTSNILSGSLMTVDAKQCNPTQKSRPPTRELHWIVPATVNFIFAVVHFLFMWEKNSMAFSGFNCCYFWFSMSATVILVYSNFSYEFNLFRVNSLAFHWHLKSTIVLSKHVIKMSQKWKSLMNLYHTSTIRQKLSILWYSIYTTIRLKIVKFMTLQKSWAATMSQY